jgi:hypothetical protein
MTKIAIMQPYFIPYAGYFRLFVDVDAFVALDDVQYTKGSWINRNRLTTFSGSIDWFNAPFARAPLGTPINALEMQPNAAAQITRQCAKFPACASPSEAARPVVEQIMSTSKQPSIYLVDVLQEVTNTLSLPTPIIFASELPIDSALRGVDRVYSICEIMKSKVYYNSSGGASLYSKDEFAKRGIELRIHAPYRGPTESILQRLQVTDPATVRREIEANMV